MDVKIYHNRTQLGTAEVNNRHEFVALIAPYLDELNIEIVSQNTGELLFKSNDLYISIPDFKWVKVWEETVFISPEKEIHSTKICAFTSNWQDAHSDFEELCTYNASEAMNSMCEFEIYSEKFSLEHRCNVFKVFNDDGIHIIKTHFEYVDEQGSKAKKETNHEK